MSSRFDARPRVKNVLPENPEAGEMHGAVKVGRFPSWLHRKLPKGGGLWQTDRAIGDNRLHTVCEEARCPNLLECWSRKTATFLVMGLAMEIAQAEENLAKKSQLLAEVGLEQIQSTNHPLNADEM